MRGLIRAATGVAGLVVLGVVGAVAWVQLADPAAYVVTRRGAILSEEAAAEQFGVVVVFVAIGAVLSLLVGAAAAMALRRLGWLLTPLVLAATLLVGAVTWRLGTWWGPDAPDAASVKGLGLGDTIPLPLGIDSFAVMLVWPIAGLLALLLVTSFLPVDDGEPLGAPVV